MSRRGAFRVGCQLTGHGDPPGHSSGTLGQIDPSPPHSPLGRVGVPSKRDCSVGSYGAKKLLHTASSPHCRRGAARALGVCALLPLCLQIQGHGHIVVLRPKEWRSRYGQAPLLALNGMRGLTVLIPAARCWASGWAGSRWRSPVPKAVLAETPGGLHLCSGHRGRSI